MYFWIPCWMRTIKMEDTSKWSRTMTEKEARAPLIGKMKNNRDKKGKKKGATMLGRLGSREVESLKI